MFFINMIKLMFVFLFVFGFIKVFSSEMDEHAFKQADQALINQQNSVHASVKFINRLQNQPVPSLFTLPEISDDIPFDFFNNKDIVLNGDNILSASEKKRLLKPYINRKLSAKDMKNLLKDCRNFYLNKGFITTRVWIPKQNKSSSVLQVKVQMGRVSDILITNQKGWYIKNSLLFKKNDVLNIRDIEQSLANLNRLSSQSYQVYLSPDSSQLGGSIVRLQNSPASFVSGLISYTKPLNKSLYPDQLLLSVDQLIGIQDQWQLSLSQHTSAVSQYLLSGLSITFPFKRLLITTSVRYFKHTSLMQSVGQRYFHYFNAYQINSAEAKWQFFSLPKLSLLGHISYQNKEKSRYLENTFLTQQHQLLNVLNTGVLLTFRLASSELTFNPQYRIGSMDFPSVENNNLNTAYFTLWHGSVSYKSYFNIFNNRLGYELYGYGFYSKTQLNATEQFSLGDQYTVRGFDGFIQGDKGYNFKMGLFKNIHYLLNPKIFIEGGKVFNIQQDNALFVLSGVLENSMQIKNISLNISYSKALKLSNALNKEGQLAFRGDITF